MVAYIIDEADTQFELSDFSVGDVWLANFPYHDGTEGNDIHPCVILKNDIGELEVLAIRTTHAGNQEGEYNPRYHIPLLGVDSANLDGNSYLVLDSVRRVGIDRFKKKLGTIFHWDWVVLCDSLRGLYPDLSLQDNIGTKSSKLMSLSSLRRR